MHPSKARPHMDMVLHSALREKSARASGLRALIRPRPERQPAHGCCCMFILSCAWSRGLVSSLGTETVELFRRPRLPAGLHVFVTVKTTQPCVARAESYRVCARTIHCLAYT